MESEKNEKVKKNTPTDKRALKTLDNIGAECHILNILLNLRRVLMLRPVLLRTRRSESPSLNSSISS